MNKKNINKKIAGTMGAMALTLMGVSIVSGGVEAKTIKVEKGDTLWGISRENSTSVANIKKLNNLNSNVIRVGQTLKVSEETTKTNTTATTYVVKKGDTLSKIGKAHGVNYKDIKLWNNLKSDLIYPGQRLAISRTVNTTPTISAPVAAQPIVTQPTNQSSVRTDVVNTAKKYLGVPYVWGGTTPKGFDCSGFIYYVMKSEGLVNSRTSTAGYWKQVKKVTNPQVGDFVFFQNTYKPGPSHMGIYIGNGQFIHASSSHGVTISSLSNSYYKQHFLGYGTVIK